MATKYYLLMVNNIYALQIALEAHLATTMATSVLKTITVYKL